MKKKGFTIVELLAVIIILSIISLIIVPKIGDVIKNARKATARNSVHGYIDAINNKLASNIVNDEVMDGIISVRDLESEIEYRGTRVDGGIVTINNNKIAEAKLCVGGYSFRYYNGEVDNSDTNYCIDKSNIEIAILGAKTTQKLSNQFSIDVDLSNSDISSVTNIVCNNNAKPSIVNGELHVDNIYGDTKCSMESSIVTTFSNIDNTVNNIVMIDDETVSSTLTIGEGKNVILDLNGKVLTKQGSSNNGVENYGDMTIKDSIGEGGVINTATGCARSVVTYGNLLMDNVYVEANGTCAALLVGYTSNPHGSATVNNSTIKAYNTHIVGLLSNDNVQLVVNNSTMEGGTGRTISVQSDGGVIINSGTFITQSGAVVKNIAGATVNINGGTYINNSGAEVVSNTSSGTINISDTESNVYIGNMFANPSNTASPKAVYNSNSGTININGSIADTCNENVSSNTTGICIFSHYRAVLNENHATGTININGGTVFSKNLSAVDNYTGTININGGTYYSTGKRVISNMSSGTMNISDSNSKVYIGNLITDPASIWTPTSVFNSGSGIININGSVADACNENINSNTSGICAFSYHRSILNESGATGTININGGTTISKNLYAVSNYTGTTNINSGIIISETTSTITDENTGVVNIIQTNTPMYVTSLAQAWKPVIVNKSTGTINITANQANACTANASDTTSGLCVYAEGNKNYTSSTSNGAVRNSAAGTINVNGGTYYGGNQGFNNHAGGTINIRNIIVSSGKYGILNNGSGLINICSTTINNAPEELHINSSSTDGVINYSSDVVFRDGASTPTLISSGGTVNAVSTCQITE